jgi:hypothetical protein
MLLMMKIRTKAEQNYVYRVAADSKQKDKDLFHWPAKQQTQCWQHRLLGSLDLPCVLSGIVFIVQFF